MAGNTYEILIMNVSKGYGILNLCIAYVSGRDIKIRQQLRDLEVLEGDSATFECEISHNDVHTRWHINDQCVLNDENMRYVHTLFS